MLNLNHLRVFAAIAREGSITGAARALHVSQPAVSKQLADFERDVDAPLFDRLPRGVRLTATGRALLAHANRVFAAEAAAEAELANLRGLARGRLTVGASTTIGSYLVPALFGRFHRAHADVQLDLHIANTSVIQDAVLHDQVDLALTEGLVSADGLEVRPVYRDELVLITPPHHPLLEMQHVVPGTLRTLPVIFRERGSGTRDVIEAALGSVGLQDIEPAMSLGSTEAIKRAVARGLGVSFVSRLTVELELAAGRLATLPVRGLTIERDLHLVTLRGKTASPAAAAFIDLIRAPSPREG